MPLKFANNQSLTSTTALPAAVPTDNLILISTQTASNSANISFTGINGTYDLYEFKFINIAPRTNSVSFHFNGSTDSGSNYNVTKTTSYFETLHYENDTNAVLEYQGARDLAQSTAYQPLNVESTNGADENLSGTLQLFNPSSTTYVKHFMSSTNVLGNTGTHTYNAYMAGYFNTTSAINAINFKMSSGNFDGIIKMYGVKKS